MKQVTYSYPASDADAVSATQLWTTATGAYVTINGALSQQIQGTVDPVARFAVFPGIQRTLTMYSTTNLSGVVFYASGTDVDGRVVTASFVGPTGASSTSAAVYATALFEFHRVNYVYATAAATGSFTIGTGATGSTRWQTTDQFVTPFSLQGTVITATIASVTPQSTINDPNTATAPTTFNHATGALTANTQFSYTTPVPFVRYIVTTNTASGVGSTLAWNQVGV